MILVGLICTSTPVREVVSGEVKELSSLIQLTWSGEVGVFRYRTNFKCVPLYTGD